MAHKKTLYAFTGPLLHLLHQLGRQLQVRLSVGGVGGSILALVDVSLSKTLNPDLLPVAVSTMYECNVIVSHLFGELPGKEYTLYSAGIEL